MDHQDYRKIIIDIDCIMQEFITQHGPSVSDIKRRARQRRYYNQHKYDTGVIRRYAERKQARHDKRGACDE